MITPVLEFIHARKWIVEGILIAAIIGGAWWFCSHLIDVGVQQQKDADAIAYVKLQRDADLETGRQKGRAEAAEKAHAQEVSDNLRDRLAHPLHGGLCEPWKLSTTPQGDAAAAQPIDAAGGIAEGNIQPVHPGDFPTGGQRGPDIRGMFDALGARADLLIADLRERKARE